MYSSKGKRTRKYYPHIKGDTACCLYSLYSLSFPIGTSYSVHCAVTNTAYYLAMNIRKHNYTFNKLCSTSLLLNMLLVYRHISFQRTFSSFADIFFWQRWRKFVFISSDTLHWITSSIFSKKNTSYIVTFDLLIFVRQISFRKSCCKQMTIDTILG